MIIDDRFGLYLLLTLPALAFSIWAQFRVKSTFHRFERVGLRSGMTGLNENQRVSYDLEQDRRGKMSAINLKSPEEAKPAEAKAAEQVDAGEAEPETAQQDPSQQDLEESKA